LKRQRLVVGGSLAIAVGSLLWVVVGPAVVLMGAPTSGRGSQWFFFEAYPWLSSSYSIANISSTYWLGFALSVIGFAVLVASTLLMILVLAEKTFHLQDSAKT